MRAIKKYCDETFGHYVQIPNDLKALQTAVGGHIQAVPVRDDIAIICDEEGLIKGKEGNCTVCGIPFFGTILAVGVKGEEFTDVNLNREEWEAMLAE